MSSNLTSYEETKATRLMRRAILQELCCPHDPNDAPPADMLQQVACALVQKAGQGDVSAIRQVLDRIDGKTVAPPPESGDRPSRVNVSWGAPQ
jgi:hypothetical protein